MKLRPVLLAGCIGLLPLAPVLADPPAHAPAHGYRAKEHRYVYYPEREVYYRPDDGIWFWMSGGSWSFGARLPSTYASYTTGGIDITLDTDRPYTEHSYVVEHYGKGKKGNSSGNASGKGGNGGSGNSGKGQDNKGKSDKHGH